MEVPTMAVHQETRTVNSVPRHARIRRSVSIGLGGLAALILVGVVVAIVAGRRQETVYPAGSPQQAVATYVRFLQNGQVDEAYAMTSLSDPMEGILQADRFHQIYDNWGQQSHRVTLVHAHVTRNTASITVEISTFHADEFGGSDATTRQTFTLVRRHGVWRITGPEYLSS
jgi:hypothetical protein